jgi:hypothetical protein
VHQPRLHHYGFHHLILSDQFVAVDGVRLDIQISGDVGMPQDGCAVLTPRVRELRRTLRSV